MIKIDFLSLLSQSILITFLVMMLMMLIEFVNVKTQGKWLFVVKQKPWLQVVLAAMLGLTPGCVGIFAVVSLYTHRMLTFGALLAACIATFGDEAFLMFATMPKQAILLSFILFVMSIFFGLLAQFFSKKTASSNTVPLHFELHQQDQCHGHDSGNHSHKIAPWRLLCIALTVGFGILIVTGVIGCQDSVIDNFSLQEHHHCNDHSHHQHIFGHLSGEHVVFLVLSLLTALLLCFCNKHFFEEHIWQHVVKKHFLKIFLWIFGILLILSLARHFIDFQSFVQQSHGQYVLLLLALLIGCVPESGPHLIVVFLFLDGTIPFTTLLANSIVQEGHGGLPILAEKPQTFFKVKLLKFVIALVVGLLGLWL